MNKIIVFIAFFISSFKASSQDLKKVALTKAEENQRIISKYVFREKNTYNELVLLLYSNGTYEYTTNSNIKNTFSSGKWKMDKGLILLNSEIQENNLPIRVSHSYDTSTRINGCRVNIIKNLSGQEVTDAFVLINNDSTRCLPSYASCYGNFSNIDSIKILLENGMTSKWIKIQTNISQQISIVIQTKQQPSMYLTIKNRKYRMVGNLLKEV